MWADHQELCLCQRCVECQLEYGWGCKVHGDVSIVGVISILCLRCLDKNTGRCHLTNHESKISFLEIFKFLGSEETSSIGHRS